MSTIRTRIRNVATAAKKQNKNGARCFVYDGTEDAPGYKPGYYHVTIDGDPQPGVYTKDEITVAFEVTDIDTVIVLEDGPYKQ